MKTQFKPFYWGKNTEVCFEPFSEVPKETPVTSCMVMAVLNNEYVVLSSPKRGWGLPGGHVEKGETPIKTAIRELREEVAVEIDKDSLQVVGGWLAKKINKTEKNNKYPDLAYQLLFIADIKDIRQFSMRFEIYDRIFVPIRDVLNYAGSENFIPVYKYVTKLYKNKFKKRVHEDKVSIIIPFLNTEEYIEKCLSSIEHQSYKNIEVILVDDGSTDKSTKICEDFAKKDERFQVIRLKRNLGPGYARNTGLDFVTGNYVTFVDSDDYVDKDYVKKLLFTARENNADMVECQNYCLIDGELTSKYKEETDKNVIISTSTQVLRNYLRHLTPRISTASVYNKLYKVDLFKNNHISFDSKLRRFEDSDIMYQLYANTSKHVYLREKLYYHVHRDNSIMRSLESINDGFEDTSHIMTKMLAYFEGSEEHFSDAMTYLRWNLTNSIQGLHDDELEEFIKDRIIKPSTKLKALYKRQKELVSDGS